MLTFEITIDKTLEVFFDTEGRDSLVKALIQIQSPGGHNHFMTESWSGSELSEQVHQPTNELVHMVTFGMYREPSEPAV